MKNAIVVMFDTLQFNYVGAYGNDWIKTPNMDRLAREGVLFENCYTEGLPTIPCRRAMLTGRYTVQESGWRPLALDDTTIADLCWGHPIDTALVFDCAPYRQPKFGYTRGFDKTYYVHGHELDQFFYEDKPLLHVELKDYYAPNSIERATKHLGEEAVKFALLEMKGLLAQAQDWKSPGDRYVAKTVNMAIEYLKHVDRTRQFFLWIDSFDPHEPWNPPSVYMNEPCPYDPDWQGPDEFMPFQGDAAALYTEPELHHIRMLYAELVTLCDSYLGKLMDTIRALGLEQDTLLMMVSDHGEPFGHGEHGHGIIRKCRPWPYEELVHTPLIIRGPGLPAGKRVKGFVQSCDIGPTVLDWLGVGVHPRMHGKSLLPLARGEISKIRDFAIAGYFRGGVSIITDDWSYIHWTRDREAMEFMKDLKKQMADASMPNTEMSGRSASPGHVATDELETGMNADVRLKAAASLDGEEQWTCTPSATFEMPEGDELYDRRIDPFQLNNVIHAHSEIAQKLLRQLRLFMSDLQAS